MWDENTSFVEDPLPGTRGDTRTPLVLIHDGGGTIFNYHCIEPPLDRRILGISNPNFHTGRSWLPGGIPEMARHYVRLMRSALDASHDAATVGKKTEIILGGWSLGGMIALEMAKELCDDSSFKIVGLVMIDSVCPLTWLQGLGHDGPRIESVASQHLFTETTKQDTRDKVTRCFAEATAMLEKWEMPTWEKHEPPPTILLRAVDHVPVEGGGVARVDLARVDPTLAWDRYRKDWFLRVIEIPGHHFNIFSDQNIERLSDALRKACAYFDGMSLP